MGALRLVFTPLWDLNHMSYTAEITKDLHVHKPITKMLMTYTDKSNQKQALICNMGSPADTNRIIKTLRWASHHGIEVIFRPV